jgi:hypothetical protein
VARRRAPDRVVARVGDLVVERDAERPTGRLLRQDDMDASYIDLADERHLEFDYLRWARIALTVAGARRVVHVGGAACALARALAAADPDGRQEVVELDPVVLDVAREHLGLRRRPGLKVRVGDGREHLQARPDDSADAIVLDAFVGARVPAHLVTDAALADARRVAPLLLVNVVDTRSLADTRAIAAGLRAAYPHVVALTSRGTRGGNVVLVGSVDVVRTDRLVAAAVADPTPARLVDEAELARLAGTPTRQRQHPPAVPRCDRV